MIVKTGRPVAITLMALMVGLVAVSAARAQPAPIPRAVVPADAAPEAMTESLAELGTGDRVIRFEDAHWLQLQFSEFDLGEGGKLTITGADGDSQTFDQAQLEAWEGLTAIFNGSEVTVSLAAGPSGEISAEIGDVIVGLPGGGTAETGLESAPETLLESLGPDASGFIPPGPERQPEFAPEAICGATDDRVASNHPASGRIMPIGCTGWIIQGGAILTAGHCISSQTQTLEFNVPPSQANGATVSPPVADQYRVISSSIVDGFTGIGNDWAVFRVLPNTQTGLTPLDAQGAAFQISNTASPTTVRITGFGVDGPAPSFGNPPPFNGDNQTQQTHTGTLTELAPGGANTGVMRYTVDTQGGNSGSPVFQDGTDVAIGIHTNGGCTTTGGANAGTSFRNQALFAAASTNPVAVTLVDTNPRRLKQGETTQVVATVTQSGAPLPGMAVAFSSDDVNLATVAPANATTDAAGRASATVTSQTSSSDSVEITATAAGESGRVTVQVPDLSTVGFALMLLALFIAGMARLRRRKV